MPLLQIHAGIFLCSRLFRVISFAKQNPSGIFRAYKLKTNFIEIRLEVNLYSHLRYSVFIKGYCLFLGLKRDQKTISMGKVVMDLKKIRIDKGSRPLRIWAILVFLLAAFATSWLAASADEEMADENSAASWLQKGHELFINGSMDEALRAYDNALAIDPGNATAWLDKALICDILARQANMKAVALFDEDLEESPTDPLAWWGRGVALNGLEMPVEAKESWEKALAIYNDTLKEDPEDAEAWFEKAEILISLGRNEEAMEAYDKAIEHNSTRAFDAAMIKANLLMQMGRYDEAVESYNRSLEMDPTDKEVWLKKGDALDAAAYQMQGPERIGAFEDAIVAYDEAIKIDPDYGNAWMKKGYSLGSLAAFNRNLSKYDESLEAFDRAIELIPDNDTRDLALAWEGRAIALTNMGSALEDAGRQDEARASREEALVSYEMAIELDPSFTGLEARLNKAGVLAELGRYNESIDAFDEIIEMLPADDSLYAAAVLTEKGIVLEEMGDYEGAIDAFDRALELDPSNMYAMQEKGFALQALGRNSEAEAAFARARDLGY